MSMGIHVCNYVKRNRLHIYRRLMLSVIFKLLSKLLSLFCLFCSHSYLTHTKNGLAWQSSNISHCTLYVNMYGFATEGKSKPFVVTEKRFWFLNSIRVMDVWPNNLLLCDLMYMKVLSFTIAGELLYTLGNMIYVPPM